MAICYSVCNSICGRCKLNTSFINLALRDAKKADNCEWHRVMESQQAATATLNEFEASPPPPPHPLRVLLMTAVHQQFENIDVTIRATWGSTCSGDVSSFRSLPPPPGPYTTPYRINHCTPGERCCQIRRSVRVRGGGGGGWNHRHVSLHTRLNPQLIPMNYLQSLFHP